MNSPCPICNGTEWTVAYDGKVRKGTFGTFVEARVFRCKECGLEYLPPIQENLLSYYECDSYRADVDESFSVDDFFKMHDAANYRRFALLEPTSLRNTIVADIGCGAGSFLDTVKGYVSQAIAIEPMKSYHASLRQRGYRVYSYATEAASDWKAKIEIAFAFTVIEHTKNPVEFLKEIHLLLKPGGLLFVSTPNRENLLMKVGGDAYKSFFYRTQHTYYFDMNSIRQAACSCGFSQPSVRSYHNYNFANFVNWLSQGRPTGNPPLSPLGENFDYVWKVLVEDKGIGDYLWMRCQA